MSEADIIVLEATNELLPPSTLAQTVEVDLKAIRSKFPAVADITHIPKWHPGKLIISNVQNETLDEIHKSCYGPIYYYPLVGNTLVYFERPYNAPKLAKLLEEEFQIGRVMSNQVIGRTSAITLIGEAFGNRTYVFYIGTGYCTPACKDRQYITFTVNSEDSSIQLLDNEDLSLRSQCGTSKKRATNRDIFFN